MASGYTIDFTDQNPFSQFELREYTTNGPVNPQNSTLDSKATRASTSLLLYGKGMPNYGERTAENLIHLLEHFAGDVAPVYPIAGQIWFDRSGTDSQLRVFDAHRYEVVPDPDNPSTGTWIGIDPPNATESAELVAEYTVGARVRLMNIASGEQLNFVVINAAAVRGSGVVAFEVTPPPTTPVTGGNWYLGGWERIIQNNTTLAEDLNAGGNKIINLAEPTVNDDAANKGYVDTAINNATNLLDTLGELNDVTLTGPSNTQVLMYDGGSNQWINSDGSSTFLQVTGGDLSGTLNMNGNFIIGVANPTAGSHAANRDYVDTQISLATGGAVNNLDGLTDVTITTPIGTGSVLVYNGFDWRNEDVADFITANNIVTRGGASLTGPLYLNTNNPTASNEAASRQFVLDQIGTITGDGVVNAALWDSGTKVLTLTRTQGLPNIDITLPGAGGSAADITHQIVDPNLLINNPGLPETPLPESPTDLAWEQRFYTRPGYPNITLENIATELNAMLGQLGNSKPRLVFTSNGGSVINLDSVTVGGQANPLLVDGYAGYSVGSNRLSVYVNGVKLIASEAGYREVTAATPADFGLWHGTETGLSPSTTYTFDVSVNGQAAVTVSVLGSNAFRVGDLVAEINAQADANYFQSGSPNSQWAFGAEIHDGTIFFVSALTGTNSSIDLTDGTLFASMVGNVSTTGSFTVDLPLSNGLTNPYTPTDYGYKEIGRVGTESYRVDFVTAPPSGAVVELIIEPHIFMEQV